MLGQINIKLGPTRDYSIYERKIEELWDLLMARSNETKIRPFSSQFFGDCGIYTKGNIEVRFKFADLYSYLGLERELKERGYPVEFLRTFTLR